MVMKRLMILSVLVFAIHWCDAQIQKPVKWSFSIKKNSPTLYEVHLTAYINDGWHIYSQTTPDGGPVATNVAFGNNPLLTMKGKAKESGKLETMNEQLFGVDVKQYEHKVDFVQVVQLKVSVKTNVSGTVEFMACNNTQCLPPTKQTFSVILQ